MQTINDRIAIVIENTQKTKTAFAESLNVSQQYISKLIRKGNPSDLLISNICEKYRIDEEWLRTGKGNMRKKVSKNREAGYYVEELLEEYADNPFYDLIIDMMKTYIELDDKSKQVVRDSVKKLQENIKARESKASPASQDT